MKTPPLICLLCSLALAQPKISVVESAALTRDTSIGARVAVAWGGLGTIFGSNLAAKPYWASSLPLPIKFGDMEVDVCAPTCTPVGLIYADPQQINFKMPDLPSGGADAATIMVKRSAGSDQQGPTPSVSIDAPGIFEVGYDCSIDKRFDDNGTPCGLGSDWKNGRAMTRGAVTDQSGHVLYSSNPARMGKNYTIWLTGLTINNPGYPFPADPSLATTNIPVYGYAGDTHMEAPASYVGNSPQFPGLNQINFQLPPGLMGGGYSAGYPPLFPCGDYQIEVSLDLATPRPIEQHANLIQIPVLIKNGDVPCAK